MHRLSRLSAGAAAAALAVAVAVVLTMFDAARSQDRAPARDRAPAAITSTNPADGAVLARAPTAVELSFAAPVNPDLSHVAVQDSSGSSVNAGRPRLVMPERLRQPVNISAAGGVTVSYHVTFVDGTELAGRLYFSVESGNVAGPGATNGPSPATTNTVDAVAGPPHQHGVDPISAALLAADGIVVLAAVALLMRRPRPRASQISG